MTRDSEGWLLGQTAGKHDIFVVFSSLSADALSWECLSPEARLPRLDRRARALNDHSAVTCNRANIQPKPIVAGYNGRLPVTL